LADRRKVFANTPYDPAKPSVEGVLDSSRYFVVRVEDGGRKAYIGMGFLERSDSFDFSTSVSQAMRIGSLISPLVNVDVALQDYTKYAVCPTHVIALGLIFGTGVGEPG
jgi:hypothetical protein